MKKNYFILLIFLYLSDILGMQREKNLFNMLRKFQEGDYSYHSEIKGIGRNARSLSTLNFWLTEEDEHVEGLTEEYRCRLDGRCGQLADSIVSNPACLGSFFNKLHSFKNEKIIWGMIFIKLSQDYRYQRNKEILDMMVKKYQFDVNFIDQSWSLVNYRNTPLHKSVSNYDTTFTKMLLDWGADVTMVDTKGRTPREAFISSCSFRREHAKGVLDLLDIADQEKIIEDIRFVLL